MGVIKPCVVWLLATGAKLKPTTTVGIVKVCSIGLLVAIALAAVFSSEEDRSLEKAGAQDAPTAHSQPKSEREKLTVKGLYIGMNMEDKEKVDDIILRNVKTLDNANDYLAPDGRLRPTMIKQTNGPNGGSTRTYGNLFEIEYTATGEATKILFGYEVLGLKHGGGLGLRHGGGLREEEEFDAEQFALQVVRAYKLSDIDPYEVRAAAKDWAEKKSSDESQKLLKYRRFLPGRYIISLNIGVEVVVDSRSEIFMLSLQKISSKSEIAAAEKLKKEQSAKQGKSVDRALN